MQKLLDEIASGTIAPIYYLCGEPYAREQVASALRQAVLGSGAENAFNYDSLLAKAAGPAGILSAARTLPMLSNRRLVQVRDAHELTTDQHNALVPYLDAPSPSTVLVLISEKADLRLKFFTKLKRCGVVARFDPLKERDVARWVALQARSCGVRLQAGAAERIGEAVGTDMGQLASAIERLGLYVGSGTPVRGEDVEELLAQTRQRSIFELTNAVGKGDRREALLVLRQMIQAREPGLRIVAMLVRHIRQLWSVKELAAAGESAKDIAARLSIHPFFVPDLMRQSQRFDESLLRRTHRTLTQLDASLKSSRLPAHALLDRAVLSLCP